MEPNATYQLFVVKDKQEHLLSVEINISYALFCKNIKEKVPCDKELNYKMIYFSNGEQITIKNDSSLKAFFNNSNREIFIIQKENDLLSYSNTERTIKQLRTLLKTQEQMIKEVKQELEQKQKEIDEYKSIKEKIEKEIDKMLNEKVIEQIKGISQCQYQIDNFNFSINQKANESKTVDQEKTSHAKGDMIMNNDMVIELIRNELKNFIVSQKEFDAKFNLGLDQIAHPQSKPKLKPRALILDNTIDRPMQCSNCLNQLIEIRYQCMSCPEYNICDDCMTLIHQCQNRNVKTLHPHFTFIGIVNLCKPINDNTTIGQSSSIGFKEIEQNKEKSINKISFENDIKEVKKDTDNKDSKSLQQDDDNLGGFVIITNNSIKTEKTDKVLGENQKEKKLNKDKVSPEVNKKNEWEDVRKDQPEFVDSKSSTKEEETQNAGNKASQIIQPPSLIQPPFLRKKDIKLKVSQDNSLLPSTSNNTQDKSPGKSPMKEGIDNYYFNFDKKINFLFYPVYNEALVADVLLYYNTNYPKIEVVTSKDSTINANIIVNKISLLFKFSAKEKKSFNNKFVFKVKSASGTLLETFTIILESR